MLKNLSDLSEPAKKPDSKDNKTPKKNQKDKTDDKGANDIPENQEVQDQIITDGNDINNLPNV